MNKQELVKSVYDKLDGLPLKQAENAVNAVLGSIKDELAKGGEINLVGFGSFAVKTQKARTGRNPQTGEKIQVPTKKVPSFKAGKGLRDAVN
ncbi:HU family DNA-binding protein [Moraxella bovis]|uniref:DNA-binding protein HU n=1 Tax=Moraxella bovis TaxID=476 RepID=A0A378PXQ1_MORBO|nr:HU family DNA-binding protein [Moraxella bovis]STY93076.1 DNA-binding protein HU [Moraxella bovis]